MGILAVHGALDLALGLHPDDVLCPVLEVCPLDASHSLALRLDGRELHILLPNLALLPRDWSAGLSPSPHLVALSIHLPVGHAVVLLDLLAVGHLLSVLRLGLDLLA